LISTAMGFLMEITKDNRKIRISMMDAIFLVAGIVIATSFSITLWVYRSLISDDVLTILAIILNIISLAVFLFRPRETAFFWLGFIFVLFIFSTIIFSITTFTRFSLLFYSVAFSVLLVLPIAFILTSLPSTIDQINVEKLGGLYTWIFFIQLMFLAILIFESKADIKVEGPSLFADAISYSIIIYKFDQKARFKVSPSANVSKTTMFKKILNVLLNTLRQKYTLDDFIESIEKSLHKIKCFTKPVIEELGSDVFLSSLISLPLLAIVLAFSSPSKLDLLDRSMITISTFITAILFILSIGIRLHKKCHINLMIGILSFRFGTIIGAVLVVITIILALINVLPKQLLILVLILIFLLFISLVFTILFILLLTTVVALTMVGGYLSQILTWLMKQPDEIAATDLILLSVVTFTIFTAFSLITCLRHDVRCNEE